MVNLGSTGFRRARVMIREEEAIDRVGSLIKIVQRNLDKLTLLCMYGQGGRGFFLRGRSM